MARKRSEVKNLVRVMYKKGYLAKTEEGTYTPSREPPPEEPELREFWLALVQALHTKRFVEALEEEGFVFPEEE